MIECLLVVGSIGFWCGENIIQPHAIVHNTNDPRSMYVRSTPRRGYPHAECMGREGQVLTVSPPIYC